MARGRPKVASIAGPSRCMKAPAAPGSSAIIGEPCETKREGREVSMRHWITGRSQPIQPACTQRSQSRVTSRSMTTPALSTAAPVGAPLAGPAPRAPSAWQLGWRQLLRDFRAGELRLLVVAVTLAVAALTAVGFFADRINGGLARDARQMLGGDAIVSSDQATPASFIAARTRSAWRRRPAPTFRAWAAPRREGRGDAAGERQGGERHLSAARQAAPARCARRQGGRSRRRAAAGHGLGRRCRARFARPLGRRSRSCSATRACASPASSSSSRIAAPASRASRRASC